MDTSLDGLKQNTEKAVELAAPWIQRLARLGYAAKGVIYVVIGIVALKVALGLHGHTTDANGALGVLLKQPFGKILLGVVAFGLLGYIVWRFIQAIFDPACEGIQARGIVTRLGYLFSAFAYAGLAYTAVKLLGGAASGRHVVQHWTAHFLYLPLGRWLVAIGGAVVVAVGVYALRVAYTAKFRKHLKIHDLSRRQSQWLIQMGRFGYAARGVVFAVVGCFLIQAALHFDPNAAQGIDGAQNTLAHFSDGLLGLIAAGLIAFGSFMFVEARYTEITIECDL